MITEFSGEFRFLSNFWPAKVVWLGEEFTTAEHAYQWAKTVNPIEQMMIKSATTPGKAKRLGRTITLRPGWEEFKLTAMCIIILSKFELNLDLRQKLLATGDEEIQEGNKWGDTFWGVCNGVGRNELGKTLMSVRNHFREIA